MRFHPLLLLAVGLTGTLAHPGPSPAPFSPVPKSAITQESCINKGCPVEESPVWDPVSGTCNCKWSLQLPGDCSEMLCIAEKHVVYDQEAGTCGCEWIPGFGPTTEFSEVASRDDVDPSTCPTVRCKDTYHAVYTPGQKHCTCEPNHPDPSTCPTIKCASWSHPVYYAETKRCSCEPNPPECSNAIFCAAGCHKVQDPSTKKCDCEVTNPIPKTCPQFKCLEYHHVVYHPETDKCGCDLDCPDLMCIAEARPTYNYSTNSCSCQYIPGLEPSSIRERDAQASPSPTPAPSKPATPIACSKIMCIPEKRPVYNATSGNCDCQWINGFEPLPIKSKPTSSTSAPVPTETVYVNPIRCSGIFCISEQHGVFNATTGRCECEWIPGLKPGEPSTLLARATPTRGPAPGCSGIMCIPEMKPVFNETSGRCDCEWMDIFKPPTNSWTSDKPTSSLPPTSSPVSTSSTSTHAQTWISPPVPVPTPTRTPSCLKPGYFCVPEMQPVYNATSGTCTCEWIPGLGPVTITAVN